MSTPYYIPLILTFLKTIIKEVDIINYPLDQCEEALQAYIRLINKYASVYESNYDGDNEDIKNIMQELNDIKRIVESDYSADAKIFSIGMLAIYRSY